MTQPIEPRNDIERHCLELLKRVVEAWRKPGKPAGDPDLLALSTLTSDSFEKNDLLNAIGSVGKTSRISSGTSGVEIEFSDDKGYVQKAEFVAQDGTWKLASLKEQCPVCFGSGRNMEQVCTICGGRGWGVE